MPRGLFAAVIEAARQHKQLSMMKMSRTVRILVFGVVSFGVLTAIEQVHTSGLVKGLLGGATFVFLGHILLDRNGVGSKKL
jgi:hypothetical protein